MITKSLYFKLSNYFSMNLFDSTLKGDESVFLDETALDFEYLPHIIKYRENQQKYIAECIKPLFQQRNGKNLLVTGSPGIGKTAATKFVLRELEEKGLDEEIFPIYINCWKKDTAYKIVLEICDKLKYKFTQGKHTSELIKDITKLLNKKPVVLVLDEVDKLQDMQILYLILEDLNKKTLILITNELEFLSNIDNRIRSRLIPEFLEFKPYNFEETYGILKQRVDYGFAKNIFNENALRLISEKTHEKADIRSGIYLLKETGLIAENESSKLILESHALRAIEKLKDIKIESSEKRKNTFLNLIKENSGKTCFELFTLYRQMGGKKSYKTFTRRINILVDKGFATKKEIQVGTGKSSIIEYNLKI